MHWYPQADLDDAEQALTGKYGRPLMELMRALSLWETPSQGPEIREIARQLGWLDRTGANLSELGWHVASPLREFLYWEERNRDLHQAFADIPWLHPDAFRGKAVLEVGSGFGCNLFTLSRRAGSVAGMDVEPLVLQFTAVLARLAGLAPPPVVIGAAETSPLADESYDIIVSFGSIQYMDIRRAIVETARALRPGGYFLFTTSTLDQFVRGTVRMGSKLAKPRVVLMKLRSLSAILSYQYLGRRIGARPNEEVWASESATKRWIRQAGLRVTDVRRSASLEICYVAHKPA